MIIFCQKYSDCHSGPRERAMAVDIFTGRKYEDIFPASHKVPVPIIKRIDYQVGGQSLRVLWTYYSIDSSCHDKYAVAYLARDRGNLALLRTGTSSMYVSVFWLDSPSWETKIDFHKWKI